MSKYSSDSNSSEDSRYQKRKSKRRSRSSSSSSNDSRYSKKRSYKHKRSKGHRSRSRDKYSKSRSHYSRDDSSRSTFGSQSSSKAKYSKSSRDRSCSGSRERSGKRKHRSKRRSKSPSKSHSKYKSNSSSSSSNYRFHSKSNSPISLDSRNVSQAGSAKYEPSSEEQLRAKLQQAIKAAQSADDLLRQQGFLTGVSTRKEEIVKEPITNILDEINSSSFIPKNFVSQSSVPFPTDPASNAVPKVTGGAAAAAPSPLVKNSPLSIFHPSVVVDTNQKLEKWVKKLFNLRQKAINGEPIA